MMKKPTPIESVPFFWTTFLGKGIRYTGHAFHGTPLEIFSEAWSFCHSIPPLFFSFLGYGEGYTEIIFKGKVEERKFLAFYIK